MMDRTNTIEIRAAFCALLVAGLALPGCQDDGGGDTPPDGTATLTQSERVLRRLTRFEYDNTIRDLFGMASNYGENFPPDDVVNNFDNNAAALQVGPLLADQMQQAADAIADAADLTRLVTCAGPQDETCARAFIQSFGPRALRRPLAADEVDRYAGLYRSGAATSFAEGIRTLISGLLQSPHFLYRTELGEPGADGRYALTPYEVASELSYLLWGSMPDDELFQRAAAGGLATTDAIAAEVKRMLQSDKARPLFVHFLDQWMNLDRLDATAKDAATYPEWTAALRADLHAETAEFFDQVLRQGGGKVAGLLTTGSTWASDSLAKFYGLPPGTGTPDAAGLRRIDLTGTGRGGLLTQGSVLSVAAVPFSSSPVHRGKLVRERLLCQALPPPPPGLMIQLPAVDPTKSTRERFSIHDQNPTCATCHRLMDPIGFGFERFDGIGRERSMENGLPIDESGEVIGGGSLTGPFAGVMDLQAKLAAGPEFLGCFTLQWFRYAYGIAEDADTLPLAQQAAGRFAQGGQTFPELIAALVGLPRFLSRASDGAQAPPADPGPPAPAPAPSPLDLGGPSPPSPYTAMVHRDSDWATGYCSTVTVTNTGASAGSWSVTLMIEGTINNLWNAMSTGQSGTVTFTGQSYNDSLAPGASTSFGFCAQK